jgi:SAM-dependent methyltransferase
MDRWKFFDITHTDHVLCNPMSSAALDEMIGLLELPAGGRVLDIACGKGEFLVRLVERYGVRGVGIDLSPYVVRDLQAKAAERVPDADVDVLEMDGAEYRGEPGSFDLASCLGASWTFGGHDGTLRALAGFVRPGGLVLVGEPYWRQPPSPEYLAAAGFTAEEFGTNAENVAAGERLGLAPLYALPSAVEDFDRYEALQWRAADRWAVAHPDDPDRDEVLERVAHDRHTYLTWQRDTLGWALYLFRRP